MKGQGEKDEEKKERKKINRGGRERQVQDKDGWSIQKDSQRKDRGLGERERERLVGRKRRRAFLKEEK